MRNRLFHIIVFGALFSVWGTVWANDAREANKAYEAGDYVLAETLYREAIEADPENPKLYFNLGNALAEQGKTQEAMEQYLEFRARAESADEKAMAEYNMGTLLTKNEDWDPAIAHLKSALKLNPSDEDARHNLELALAKKEEQEGENQQQNNEDQPEPSEYAKAIKQRAEQLVEQRRYKAAYQLMQEALKSDKTVSAFRDFTERIKNVAEIDEQ
ncbi:MAG: tetratricopeptide repeat protein [Bacteroidota bacterium]